MADGEGRGIEERSNVRPLRMTLKSYLERGVSIAELGMAFSIW
jgi:hypothetical protein